MSINPNEQLPADILDGQLGLPRDVVAWLNAHRARAATKTTDVLHIYANGDTGSDGNTGLSSSSPKKTVQAAFDLVPDILHHMVIVHLSGNFAETDLHVFSGKRQQFILGGTSLVLIDGGTDLAVVDNNDGDNYTTTGSSVSSLVVGAAGWTPQESRGYIVEVLTGSAAGEQRLIVDQTADTITPGKNFSVDPGVGATFRIVRPATTLNVGTFFFYNVANTIVVQNLYWADGVPQVNNNRGGVTTFTHCIVESTANASLCTNCSGFSMTINTKSPADGTSINNGTAAFGLSMRGGTTRDIRIRRGDIQGIHGSLLVGQVSFSGCQLTNYVIDYGSRIIGPLEISNVEPLADNDGSLRRLLGTSSGYATTTIENTSGVGLKITGSNVILQGGQIINCGSHAIEVRKSFVRFTGSVAGTGNTGAGLFAHAGSTCYTTDGAVPSVTGTIGDVTFEGTAEEAEWSSIEAGTIAKGENHYSVVREEL